VASSLFNAFDLGIGSGSIILGLASEHFETYQAAFRGAMANCFVFLGFYLLYYFVLHPPSAKAKLPISKGEILPKPGPGQA
jgi:predicted MFS family arabinose efflux permease